MSHLYILENGGYMTLEGGTFRIEYQNGLIRKIPKESVESITMIGKSQISTQCMCELLERGISVTYFSKGGKYFGRLESTNHKNIKREKMQIAMTEDEEFALGISKQFIQGKTNNQLVLLRKYKDLKEPYLESSIEQILRLRNKIEEVETLEELIGYEGMISKLYFDGISHFLKSDFSFKGRSKRPPKDAFNSMLSFGYTVLMYMIYEAIESRGLNPYAGFLHQDKERHPTLASDLMEEFRSVIVDSVVIQLIQGNEITVDEFEKDIDSGGIVILSEGIKKLVTKINKKVETGTKYFGDQTISYRRGFWIQAGNLLKSIEERDYTVYKPLKIR